MGKKVKASRPDVRQRLLDSKKKVNQVVKASLPGRLAPTLPPIVQASIRDEVDAWVLSSSKIIHRMSLICNRLLIHCLDNQLPLPEFEQAFFTGMAFAGMKVTNKSSSLGFSEFINTFVETEFEAFPSIQRQRGDCQAITILAKRYMTNFKNACIYPFFDRQKSFVYLWCELNKVKCEPSDVLFAINGWINGKKDIQEIEATFSPKVKLFIAYQRNLLGSPDKLCEASLKRKLHNVIRYYYDIISYMTTVGGKRFSIAPVCTIKAHFLTIDNTVLCELLKNVILRSRKRGWHDQIPRFIIDAVESNKMSDMVWKSVFNYEGLRRRREFGNQVETDGVSVCFHFTYTKKRMSRAKRRFRSKQKRKHSHVITVDPGRSNIIFAHSVGTSQYYKLTRKQYYTESGMTHRFQKKQKDLASLTYIYNQLSNAPARSVCQMDWFKYQSIITQYYDILWSKHTQTKHKRAALRVYALKQKCLDRFFNRFLDEEGKRPLVVYGAASMNPTGKGELSVPVQHVYKKCSQRFTTIKTDECMTTVMHHKCQQRTKPVYDCGIFENVRGLRWCPTCRELVSRDKNPCHNLAAIYHASERPKYLRRASTKPDRDASHKINRGGLRGGHIRERTVKNIYLLRTYLPYGYNTKED